MSQPFKSRVKENIAVLLAFIVIIIVALYVRNSYPEETKNLVFGIMMVAFVLINLVILIITKRTYLVYNIIISANLGISYLTNHKGAYVAITFLVFFTIGAYFFYKTMKFQRNFFKILRLASARTESKNNGLTKRPMPLGKHEYSKDEIIEFSRYLNKATIANYYKSDNGVYVVLTGWHHFPINKPKENHDSYVFFEFDGNILVNIAQRDYNQYQDKLTFHELCEALGGLFLEFFELYKKGEKEKISDLLNSKTGENK
ncbi:MAG: hypothetical protein JXQ65_13005 [Candidatus Marinimicrobia bacterium]|nr:hypothetical protein [Candidatus Neomarinimicrobiota bacterium]